MKFIEFKFKPHVGKWSCNSLIQFNLERSVPQCSGRQFTPQAKFLCGVADSSSLVVSVSFPKHRGPDWAVYVPVSFSCKSPLGNSRNLMQLGVGHTPRKKLSLVLAVMFSFLC